MGLSYRGDDPGPEAFVCVACGRPMIEHDVVCSRSDLIGLERSESPSFAPWTLTSDASESPAICVHRGNTPAQSDIPTFVGPVFASSPGVSRPQGGVPGCGTLGLASDGMPVALDPIGSRARLRDALHGDDGSPGNGRVGARQTDAAEGRE